MALDQVSRAVDNLGIDILRDVIVPVKKTDIVDMELVIGILHKNLTSP